MSELFHSFKIVPHEDSHVFYDIYMDGEQVHGVTHLAVLMGVDMIPTVMMEVRAAQVEVELREGVSKEFDEEDAE